MFLRITHCDLNAAVTTTNVMCQEPGQNHTLPHLMYTITSNIKSVFTAALLVSTTVPGVHVSNTELFIVHM